MKNKKGFTLIELLAVVVILAILMVIAIPKILDVINESRKSAWNSNVKLIKKAIEINTRTGNATVKGLCNDNETTTNVTVTNKIKEIADFDNTNITCKKDTNYIFTLNGINNFSGRTATITCTSEAVCTYEVSNVEPAPAPVAFETDSWATIAQNTTSELYQVGDEKAITMDVNDDGTPETYHIMIVNTTPCTTEESRSACGLVFQFKEVLNITNTADKKMNDENNNRGGWPGSKMYTYVNTTIFNKLPSDLKNVIVDTKVISSHATGSSGGYDHNNQNFESYDKLYLPSTQELGVDNMTYDNSRTKSRKLDYYPTGTSSSSQNVRKKYIVGTTTYSDYWLRSAKGHGYGNFYCVYDSGYMSDGSASYEKSIAPLFKLAE